MALLFRLACTLGAASAVGAALPLGAQPTGPRAIPSTYAITNARVVPVAGPVVERGTILVRDGLIAAVGARVAVPADARVVDGTGLTVYPGFIDGQSALGLAPARTGGQGGGGGGAAAAFAVQTSAAGTPSRLIAHPAGFQPEASTADQLRIDAEGFASAHGGGVTAALTAPTTGVMQGRSALITLGDDPATLVIKAPVAQHVGFTPVRGGAYPNSLLGVFSALRQTLLDAQHYRDEQAAYARTPRGMQRPTVDPALEALQPVLARTQPVVMQANLKREIERALDLAREFNLRAVIAGGSEAHLVAARLKAENVPVLLSANYPRRPQTQSADADPEPLRVLRERAEAPRTAARLAQAGVRFAFQSGGLTNGADFLANVQRSIEDGLSADQAVRALTQVPAELFGVGDRMGTIEAGKVANLTLMRGALGERGARVAQLFVDGRPVTVRAATAATGDGAAGALMANGAWTATVALDNQSHAVTLTLRQEGERLSGSMQGDLGTAEIAGGSVGSDGAVRFTAPITLKEGTEEATFTGTIEGSAIRGRVTIVGHEPGTFSGTRPTRGAGGPPNGTTRQRPDTTPSASAPPVGTPRATQPPPQE
jgi:imidazolonepropionase-like amidohydrolase